MKDSLLHVFFRRAQKRRFQTLFVCLLLLVAMIPFFEVSSWGRIVLYVGLNLNLMAAVLAVSDRRHAVTIATLLLSFALISSTWSTFFPGIYASKLVSESTTEGLNFIAFVFAAYLIFLEVIRAGPVGTDKIFAAICVYLLAGIAWALLYMFIYLQDHEAFRFAYGNPVSVGSETSGTGLFSHICYYSFITQSTLGYGDITPATAVTRTMSWLQAVLGQLYLAVLIARLVGLNAQQAHENTEKQD